MSGYPLPANQCICAKGGRSHCCPCRCQRCIDANEGDPDLQPQPADPDLLSRLSSLTDVLERLAAYYLPPTLPAPVVFNARIRATAFRVPDRNVTDFTPKEGTDWFRWPDWSSKPEATYLDRAAGKHTDFIRWDTHDNSGLCLYFHSLRFSDGREWDVVNGWRSA